MSWSKEWPVGHTGKIIAERNAMQGTIAWLSQDKVNALIIQQLPEVFIGIDLGKDDKTVIVIATVDDAGIHVEKVYNNKVPTHDPYTNPDAQIYYQCGCGDILDPGTKSFAALNNAAMNAGWKVRWGSHSYLPYCIKCGEGVE